MSAPKRNRFWELRANSGRKRKYDTAQSLKKACIKYFEWVEDNPIEVQKHALFKGKAFEYFEERPRAMLLAQLCRSLGVTQETWSNWRKTRQDLSEVITWAESVIWEQKFQGAAAELFNSNIIAQELGLKSRLEHTLGDTLEEFLEGLEEDDEGQVDTPHRRPGGDQ